MARYSASWPAPCGGIRYSGLKLLISHVMSSPMVWGLVTRVSQQITKEREIKVFHGATELNR
jgi:hypothetical protein